MRKKIKIEIAVILLLCTMLSSCVTGSGRRTLRSDFDYIQAERQDFAEAAKAILDREQLRLDIEKMAAAGIILIVLILNTVMMFMLIKKNNPSK